MSLRRGKRERLVKLMNKELRVLLVDDDEDEYILLRDMFSRLPGTESAGRYRLDWAPTYEDALRRCQSTHHDIHLIDYHLGRRTGLDLLRAIDDLGCSAPSILLTGQGSYELDLAAMQQGVYDYLLKDQVNETLLERTIRYALERRETEEELERRVQQRTQELAQANAVLRESEARFRALANTTSAAIFIVQDAKIRYANPAARFVTGYSPDELVGTELWQMVHPAYQESVRSERLVSSWAVDLPARYEIKIIHKNGSERWVDVTVGEMEYKGEQARVFTAFDITERDLAERALRKVRDELEERVSARTSEIYAASQRMRAILTTLPVGMVIAGADGRITESNQAFTDLWEVQSVPPGQRGKTGELSTTGHLREWPALPATLSENDSPVVLSDWLAQRTVRQGEPILAVPVDIRTFAGARKTILYSSVPIFDPSGHVLGGVAVLQDITQQRQLEQQAKAAALTARQRAEEMDALHSATAALLDTLDIDELLCRILDAAQNAIPAAEKGMLHLATPSTGMLHLRATLGFADERICVTHSDQEVGLSSLVVRESDPVYLADLQSAQPSSALFAAVPAELRHARSVIFAPLLVGERLLGTLSLSSDQPNAFTESNLRLLKSFATTTTAALQNALLHNEMKQMANKDPLTGEFNRRAFFDMGQRELERFHRTDHPLSAIMLDLDNFKTLNDTYGHVAGDQILRMLAQRCRASIREIDIFGRYGGDEFALLLPDTDLPAAVHVADRIREAVLSAPWMVESGPAPVSISLGVSCAARSHRVLEELLAEADRALLAAKNSGRNRITVREPETR